MFRLPIRLGPLQSIVKNIRQHGTKLTFVNDPNE
jgi:hypothetical protein